MGILDTCFQGNEATLKLGEGIRNHFNMKFRGVQIFFLASSLLLQTCEARGKYQDEYFFRPFLFKKYI